MSGKQPQRLAMLLTAAVLGLVLPHMLGAGYLAAMLLALPLIVTGLAQSSRLSQERFDAWRLAGYALVAGASVMTLPVLPESLALPGWMIPPAVMWLAAAVVALTVPEWLRGIRRPAFWAASCAATALLALTMAYIRYDGRIIPGLTESLTARINAAGVFDKPRLLTLLYSSGLARLDEKNTALLKAGVSLAGTLGVSPQIQEELLLSFGTTMRALLPSLLPRIMVNWCLLTVGLTTLTGEWVLRHGGGTEELPRFGAWYMPTGIGRGMMAMMATGLLPMLVDSDAAAMLAGLCNTLGYWAFAVQGAALIQSLSSRPGEAQKRGTVMAVLGLLIAPLLLVLMGLFDQFRDPRALREDFTDDEND